MNLVTKHDILANKKFGPVCKTRLLHLLNIGIDVAVFSTVRNALLCDQGCEVWSAIGLQEANDTIFESAMANHFAGSDYLLKVHME